MTNPTGLSNPETEGLCERLEGLATWSSNLETAYAMRRAISTIRRLSSEADGLREALTPSGDTKAAYHGEFKFQVTQWRESEDPDAEEDIEEYLADFTVPWTTVKEIMAAILARAALAQPKAEGERP